MTKDHDFLTYALGSVFLHIKGVDTYGVYDSEKNSGYVSIGMFLREASSLSSSDTPKFAVESIERWWNNEGRK